MIQAKTLRRPPVRTQAMRIRGVWTRIPMKRTPTLAASGRSFTVPNIWNRKHTKRTPPPVTLVHTLDPFMHASMTANDNPRLVPSPLPRTLRTNQLYTHSTKKKQKGTNPTTPRDRCTVFNVQVLSFHRHHGPVFVFFFPTTHPPAQRPQQAVVESVLACEREQQAQLLSSVVLAGGGCCFEGLAERLKAEIEVSLDVPSTGWRVKVLAAGSHERK